MRLVDDQQEVVREVVQQRPGRRAGRPQRQQAAVVLDAGTVADLAQHLQVVVGALLEPLRFQQLALVLEELELAFQLLFDDPDRPVSFSCGVTKCLAG